MKSTIGTSLLCAALALAANVGMATTTLAQDDSSAGGNEQTQAQSAAPAPAMQNPGVPQVTESQTFGSWAVRCYRAAATACDISQSVILKPRNIRELGISIAYIPSRDAYAGEFIVPLGVSFAKGMTIAVGNYALSNLKFRRCERQGCSVEGVLPAALIDAMTQSSGGNGTVQIEAVNNRKYAFPFALDGFRDGIALLKQLDVRKPAATPAKP